jgi:predicted nucleotidyltransferase
MNERGLNDDGTIAREGALDRVPAAFLPVVAAARARITDTFGTRLHSAYLYGSIPRGTAVPGVSDLDLLVVLNDAPADADHAAARAIEAVLDDAFAQINGAGVVLSSTASSLSELERHDGGFFLACLCTPLLGEDLAGQLPSYRPTGLLARETNGDLALVLPRWRTRAAAASTDADRRALSRALARRLVRTGFTLIMPRWGGWTSDLERSADLFGCYYPERAYPERAAQMRVAAAVARAPSADPAVLDMLIDDLGLWLAAEYTAVHGEKALRPDPGSGPVAPAVRPSGSRRR